MPTYSYRDYTRLLLATPGTAEEIAARVGGHHASIARLLSSFWRLGLCYPGGIRRVKMHANKTAVWFSGDGEACDGLRVQKARRPKAQHIAFASVWKAFQDGATAHGAAAESGASKVSVYAILAELRAANAIHVSTWEKDALGRAVAVWMLGSGRDAKKPPAKRAGEKAREYRGRLAIKALTMLGYQSDVDAYKEAA